MLRRLYLVLLGIALIAATATVARRALGFHEVAWDSDPFGYLQEAQIFRRFYRGQGPLALTIPSARIREAAGALKRDGVPLDTWRWWLGPLVTHYFPDTRRQGIQYPPGTGFVLSLFPEGRAVACVDLLTAALLCGLTLFRVLRLARRGRWASAGPLCLCALLGLDLLRRAGDTSYSIQVSLLLAICLAAAWRDKGKGGAVSGWIFGALSGLLVLVRIANLFVLPGLFLALSRERRRLGEALLGAAVFGALPLFLFQKSLTGHFLGVTYSADDKRWAPLHSALAHLNYYLGSGGGAVYNWVLLCCAAGCVAIAGWRLRGSVAAVLIWLLPAGFFVLHDVAVHYYLLIPLFLSALWLGLNAAEEEPARLGPGAVAVALIPGLVTLGWAGSTLGLASKPFQYESGFFPALARGRETRPAFPPELLEPRAWVYAYLMTGSLWYYAGKSSFEILNLPPRARLSLYQLAYDRAEPQYFVDDWEVSYLPTLSAEAAGLGGRLVRLGEVEGHAYYRLEWWRRPKLSEGTVPRRR